MNLIYKRSSARSYVHTYEKKQNTFTLTFCSPILLYIEIISWFDNDTFSDSVSFRGKIERDRADSTATLTAERQKSGGQERQRHMGENSSQEGISLICVYVYCTYFVCRPTVEYNGWKTILSRVIILKRQQIYSVNAWRCVYCEWVRSSRNGWRHSHTSYRNVSVYRFVHIHSQQSY